MLQKGLLASLRPCQNYVSGGRRPGFDLWKPRFKARRLPLPELPPLADPQSGLNQEKTIFVGWLD